jgi:hypothetical protein
MVDVFATFLKLGFDAKDKFDSIVGDIKKNTKGIDKTFDNTLNPLKAVFDGVIQLANSFLSVSVKADELNDAKTQLAKEETVDKVPPMPPLPKVDAPQTPQTSDAFPKTPTRPGVVQAAHTGGVIRGYNRGGRIDPTTPITRGVETQRREVPKPKPIIQPQKSTPGKDVGGDKKVKQLYDQTSAGIPDFIPLPSFFRSDKKSGFAALMGASEEYKKPMTNDILGIGNMMGASVDSALGQKIEKRSYTQFADGIKYLVNYGRTEPEEFAKLDLEDMVRKIVEPRVNMAINRIQEEINKKSTVEPGFGEGGEGGFDFGGDIGDYADLIALIVAEESAGHGGYEAFNTGGYGSAPSGSANSINTPVGGILKPLTQRTVKDIMNMHNRWQIHATGRYQIIATTLRGLINGAYGETGVSENDLYDAATQDKLAIALIKHRLKNPTLQNFRDEWTGLNNVPDNVLKAAIEKAKIGRLYNVSGLLSSNLKGLVLHSGPGGLIQGGSGSRGEADYAVHFHLDTKNPNPTKEELANVREVAFQAVKIMLARGSTVYFGNVKEYASSNDNTLKRQIAEDQRRHAQRSTPGVDIQEINPNVGPTIKGLPGSRIAFPFAVGRVYRKGGYGREAEIVGSGGVVVSHGAAGSAASVIPRQTPPQQIQTPRQAPRTSSSGPLTPLASSERRGFLINNQMYYVDLKTGFITNSQGKTINDESIGNAILQRLTPSDRQRLEKLKKQKGSQNIPWWGRMLPGISSIEPNLPTEKYLSYNQPDSQKPSYIQPVIISNQVPVPVSSGAVPFAVPVISSSDTQLT